ncbi:hypothetical protein ECE50_009550 [Chitinophaga sp. Mgbs1]|uniref:Uncharacterized protein n=2 Tax=Chitinophaga solisilvae TaxID=1233460 RepID=A0A9Q5D3R5_9BACT|nr:hypothetical protein [Chitinophaga solisilvae]
MKNLPSTIGMLMVLTVFFLFQGNPEQKLQAAPVKQATLEILQDTFPPDKKKRDTIMPARKHKDREPWKKHEKDTTHRKDTIK